MALCVGCQLLRVKGKSLVGRDGLPSTPMIRAPCRVGKRYTLAIALTSNFAKLLFQRGLAWGHENSVVVLLQGQTTIVHESTPSQLINVAVCTAKNAVLGTLVRAARAGGTDGLR